MAFEEKKIRETLKKVFELYETVSDFIFTTYDFDPMFFEDQIISYLMGFDKRVSTLGELNAANEWIYQNNVCVYYDIGGLKADSILMTIPTYAKSIGRYVFHPKVIVISGRLKAENGHKKGRKAVHLIVSSCNLTVSGYGRNLEAFSVIKVSTRKVAESLYSFLDWLRGEDKERHNSVCEYLKGNSFSSDNSVEFFWNNGNDKSSVIKDLLAKSDGNIMIVSPYFDDDGPSKLLNELSESNQITIIPALDGDHYNIRYSDYKKMIESGIRFSTLNYKGNENRFAHAKIICLGNLIIVGSYNFTSSALCGFNAEAALIYKSSSIVNIKEQPIDEMKFLPDSEEIDNKDENKSEGADVFVSILIDWEKSIVTITVKLPPAQVAKVLIDGEKHHDGWLVSETITTELSEKDKLAFVRHKKFSVYINDRFCLSGIVSEKNWYGIRPELACLSLDETLLEWYKEDRGNRTSKEDHVFNLRPIAEEEYAFTVNEINNNRDVFDNYYLVAYSLGRLCKEIESIVLGLTQHSEDDHHRERCVEAEKNLFGILVSRPGSMSRILDFFPMDDKDEKGRDDVLYWLVFEYLKKAYNSLPETLKYCNLVDNYQKQKIEFESRLKAVEIAIRKRINVDPRYFDWIEEELFVNEDSDV